MVGFGEVDQSVASARVFQQHAADVDVKSQRETAIFYYFATRVVKLEVVENPGSRRSGPNPQRRQSTDQDNRTEPSQRKTAPTPFRQLISASTLRCGRKPPSGPPPGSQSITPYVADVRFLRKRFSALAGADVGAKSAAPNPPRCDRSRGPRRWSRSSPADQLLVGGVAAGEPELQCLALARLAANDLATPGGVCPGGWCASADAVGLGLR